MLLLLLLLSLTAVSHALKTQEVNMTTCKVNFFGKEYTRAYVAVNDSLQSICFKGFYQPGQNNDCFLGDHASVSGFTSQILQTTVTPGSSYHKTQPINPASVSPCTLYILFENTRRSQQHRMFVRPFGYQTVLNVAIALNTMRVTVMVDGVIERKSSVLSTTTSNTRYRTTFTGCIFSGHSYGPNSAICQSIDSILHCNKYGEPKTEICGEDYHCESVGEKSASCVPDIIDATCTVIGSSLIDFFGNHTIVPDRCEHTLFSDDDFSIKAFFQDRRRADVSFLESVWLVTKNMEVLKLKQGGRVEFKDSVQNIPGGHRVFLDYIEVTKDQTGVTVKILNHTHSLSLFFNGNTAQIHMKEFPVLVMKKLNVLCSNAKQNLAVSRTLTFQGCEVMHNDADPQINCKNVNEHCNLLTKAPFDACHNHSRVEPYVAACKDFLCKYPMVDGLGCQFLEAYARACSLHSNHTQVDIANNCPAPKAFCQDKFCKGQSFCAEERGTTICMCRAIFASKYRSTNTLGELAVCKTNSASVTLIGCLLEEKGIDFNALHLNDKTCKGSLDQETGNVVFSFDSDKTCGTEVTANNSKKQVIFKNAIQNTINTTDVITYDDQVYIDFSCFHNQPALKTFDLAFRITDSSVMQTVVSGDWKYNLTMKAYTDEGRKNAVNSKTKIQLDQMVWMELKTYGLNDKQIALVIESCWATNKPSSNDTLKYEMIVNGCSKDKMVTIKNNGQGTSNYFSFNMFRFVGKSDAIYLHCKLNLCVKKNNSCIQKCSGDYRRRRSARSEYEDDNPAFITMAWTT